MPRKFPSSVRNCVGPTEDINEEKSSPSTYMYKFSQFFPSSVHFSSAVDICNTGTEGDQLIG